MWGIKALTEEKLNQSLVATDLVATLVATETDVSERQLIEVAAELYLKNYGNCGDELWAGPRKLGKGNEIAA